jgi:hypothetical protein
MLLIFFERDHHYRALIFAGDEDRGVIVTDLLHGCGEMAPSVCISNGIHLLSFMLHAYN